MSNLEQESGKKKTDFGDGNEFTTTTATASANVDTGLMNSLTGLAVTIAINTIGALMISGAEKDFREMKENGE